MKYLGSLRLIGFLLLAGLVIFSIATIIAEPFEQETPEGLYSAVASNRVMYQTVNILATVGLAILTVGLLLLTLRILPTRRSLAMICLVLFAVAPIFWVAEVIARFTTTAAFALPATGGAGQLNGLGIGFDPLFLGFFSAALLGTALLVWGLGQAGILSARIATMAALIILFSGAVATIFYPWVGGVERVMFYPLVLVVLPLAIYFIFRRQPTVDERGL